ncbi:MAG: DUF962 domain-containing protein [Vicinamibacteria bacterium]
MRRVDALFERYAESHRHPRNKAIHWVCVPLITWSLLAILWWIAPAAAYVLIGVAMLYYARLSFTIAIGMLAVAALMVYALMQLGDAMLPVAIAVFVAAWAGQFVGHRIEGKQPSFVEDVRFLLVGPAWPLADAYRRFGIPY